MKEYAEAFDALSRLLVYPSGNYHQQLDQCSKAIAALKDVPSEIGRKIKEFANATQDLTTAELEELYTRTFDINPISSLEVGWHLHGETYERGAFLVSMRSLLYRLHIEESTELPDHLSHVLQALARMDPLEGSSFISNKVLKALDKMLEGFADHSSPYENILSALKELLTHYASSYAGV